MSEMEELWRRKTDYDVIEACKAIDEYGPDGQLAIRAESYCEEVWFNRQ